MVEQEAAALSCDGHVVERFERSSDDIAGWPAARKALVPAQVLWSDEARRTLSRTLRAFRPDIVHVHNTFPLLSASVLYACRSAGVPVVATLHNYRLVCPSGDLFREGGICHDCVGRRVPLPAVRHGCYRGSSLATLPLAAGLVAHRRAWRTMVSAYVFLSRAQRDLVAPYLPPARLFVKPNFVPPMPAPAAAQDHMVVYAGRLSPPKGIHLLMQAWDRYIHHAGESPLRLAVAGGPLEQRLESWADRPAVDWLGMLNRSATASLVARARAAIVPSAWEEPFGLVVVEAMAAGVPSVAPAHGSFPELITDGADGVLFEPGNASALAEVLRDVESRPEYYAQLGRAARSTYERRFTSEANLKQLLEIYEHAIEHPVN